MPHLITGLDVGSAQIKCIIAERRRDGSLALLSVLKVPSAGIRKGVVVDVEAATGVLRDLVRDVKSVSKQATQNVFVNMNSEHACPRFSRGIAVVARPDQEIQDDDVDRVNQASQAVKLSQNHLALHHIVREYFVDDVGDILDPRGMTGTRLEVSTLIIEAFAPQLTLLSKTLERVGLRVAGPIFNPLAAAEAILSKRQKDLGVLLVDFGFGTTSIAVYEESKIIHAKSLPIGSGYITNDIAIGLRTSVDVAEKLKTSFGSALSRDIGRREMINLADVDASADGEVSRRFLSEIVEVRLAEILDLVRKELKTVGRDVQLPGGVVITGGGAKLPGIVDLVKQELKLPVQLGFPNVHVFDIMNPAHEELLDDTEFGTAVGLVRWGSIQDERMPNPALALKSFFKNLIP